MAVALGDLTLRFNHHLSALWWLGLLYRRPQEVRKSLEGMSHLCALRVGVCLLLHALPAAFVLAFLARILPLGLFEPGEWPALRLSSPVHFAYNAAIGIGTGTTVGMGGGIAAGIAVGIAEGVASGIAFGIAFGIAGGIAFGIPWGILIGLMDAIAQLSAVGIAGGITGTIAIGIIIGIAGGIAFGTAFGTAGTTPGGLAGGIVSGIAGTTAGGLAGGVSTGIAFGISLFRAYYYPAHFLFVFPAVRGRWYRFHPVAWDDLCWLPFLGLHRLLVAYAALHPAAGAREIERLITIHPSQRNEALKARTILVARAAGAEPDLAALDARMAALPEGDNGFLKQVPELRARAGEIAQIQRRLNTRSRPAFREPVAAQLVTTITYFRDQVAGLREPLASEFFQAAGKWLMVAQAQLADVSAVVSREPTTQVFRAGDPVDRATEAFVPRMPVIEELVGQIMLANGCPGLLLYGRRRMGKSTLLRNLDEFLPESILVGRFSMQNPAAFTSLKSFAGLVAQTAVEAMGETHLETASDSLAALFKTLTRIDAQLAENDRRLLLACDEFEMIDEKIGERVFTLDLLATIRESVQAHRRLIWVFAGSHDLSELRHSDWSSYFVSLRTIEVLPFTPKETELLLTEPLKYSLLWRERDKERPRFDPTFWGEGGIERIQAETGGWPHLVQLVAETAVDIANDKGVSGLDAAMLNAAFVKAVERGDAVLRQLVEGENHSSGERTYLRGFRDRETQPPPENPDVRAALRRRRLFLDGDDGWRLRAPLMQRWIMERC